MRRIEIRYHRDRVTLIFGDVSYEKMIGEMVDNQALVMSALRRNFEPTNEEYATMLIDMDRYGFFKALGWDVNTLEETATYALYLSICEAEDEGFLKDVEAAIKVRNGQG